MTLKYLFIDILKRVFSCLIKKVSHIIEFYYMKMINPLEHIQFSVPFYKKKTKIKILSPLTSTQIIHYNSIHGPKLIHHLNTFQHTYAKFRIPVKIKTLLCPNLFCWQQNKLSRQFSHVMKIEDPNTKMMHKFTACPAYLIVHTVVL